MMDVDIYLNRSDQNDYFKLSYVWYNTLRNFVVVRLATIYVVVSHPTTDFETQIFLIIFLGYHCDGLNMYGLVRFL